MEPVAPGCTLDCAEEGRGASSYRDNPSSVLLDLRRPGDCALITVLLRPAFREMVVGREPHFEIGDLTPSSHHKNTPIAVQTHAATGRAAHYKANASGFIKPSPRLSSSSTLKSRAGINAVSTPVRVYGFVFYLHAGSEIAARWHPI